MLGSVFAEGHSRNSLFEETDPVHRFNPTVTNRLLRQEFASKGVEINTADVNVGRQVDFEIHMDGRPLGDASVPRFLVALENPYLNPLNANERYLKRFHRVFSWNHRFAYLPNFRQIFYPNEFVEVDWPSFKNREIFSCLINANKRFKKRVPNDLYEARLSVIRWYEKNAPKHFHLYGLGWNKPPHERSVAGRLHRRVQRLATQILGYRPFPSWKGELPSKSAVLLKAKFAYCYENVYGLSGYVTEKIFDCMMYGSVPVYWGADDIDKWVPRDCFIDRRDFRDTSDVHQYLMAMTESDYAQRQESIRRYIREDAEQFRASHYVNLIVEDIWGELSLAVGRAARCADAEKAVVR